MSLGENLQFLRKRNNITQEELAEKLEVSRQSVSKWESDASYPEMEKLIQLSQMFHCRIDDLIQEDVSTLYVEDKSKYDEHFNLFSKMTALGVGLILLGISIMIFISGIRISANENINEGIGFVVFFIFLIIAVAIFIVTGIQHGSFEQRNLYIEDFYSKEDIESFNKKFSVMVAAGVSIILIGVVIFAGSDFFISEAGKSSQVDLESIFGSIFMLFITVAVTILVYAGMQKDKYNIKEYNLMHDTESEEYKKGKLIGAVCGTLMMSSTIIYIIVGFVAGEWGMPTIVVFPVGGICCGIASVIINAIRKK